MIPNFRAWDKGTDLMNDVTVIDFENEEVYYNHWRYGHSEAISFKDIELLQSTGLKDKNGVEIFEGDIISCEIETIEKFIICEQCGCFGIRDKVDGFISLNSINETLSINKEFEIIGNIYKHPYLLEE